MANRARIVPIYNDRFNMCVCVCVCIVVVHLPYERWTLHIYPQIYIATTPNTHTHQYNRLTIGYDDDVDDDDDGAHQCEVITSDQLGRDKQRRKSTSHT